MDNIPILMIGNTNEDDGKKSLRTIIENIPERGIIIIGGHFDVMLHAAKELAHTLHDHHHDIVIIHTDSASHLVLSDDVLAQKPAPTMENLIQQIGKDLEKRVATLSDNYNEYEFLKKSEVFYKKEQEKLRRKHLNKKKITGRKK